MAIHALGSIGSMAKAIPALPVAALGAGAKVTLATKGAFSALAITAASFGGKIAAVVSAAAPIALPIIGVITAIALIAFAAWGIAKCCGKKQTQNTQPTNNMNLEQLQALKVALEVQLATPPTNPAAKAKLQGYLDKANQLIAQAQAAAPQQPQMAQQQVAPQQQPQQMYAQQQYAQQQQMGYAPAPQQQQQPQQMYAPQQPQYAPQQQQQPQQMYAPQQPQYAPQQPQYAQQQPQQMYAQQQMAQPLQDGACIGHAITPANQEMAVPMYSIQGQPHILESGQFVSLPHGSRQVQPQ